MQSYCHKIWMTFTVLTFAIAQSKMVFYLLAALYAIDAIAGMLILKQVFEEYGMVEDFEQAENE